MTVGTRSLRGSARRGIVAAAASALVLALLPGAAFGAQENTDYLEGADNVGAALAWSQFAFESAASVAVGRDDVFADSLASGLIQGLGDGVPLLLTDSDALDDAVAAEIERLGATTAHILGGETAISSAVEDELEASGLTIHRHAGASRVETAIDIASRHGADATTAIVARAFGGSADPTQAFADSLAAGAWAAESGFPILLTQTGELHDAVEAYLASSDIENVNIVGGTSAVSDAVKSSIEAMGITVTRVSGATRFDTAVAVAEARGFDSAADATDGVVVVEGQAADSWAAGFAAAAYAANPKPILLVNGDDVPAATEAFLAGGNGTAVVCAPGASVTACDAVSAALGNDVLVEGGVVETEGPDLVAVEVGGGDDDDDVRSVIFTFDENVNDDAVSENEFVLYDYEGDELGEVGESDVDGNQVEIEFDFDEVDFATVAAVRQGAVQDEDGNENIEASAPLQDVELEANVTDAPDITDVELDDTDDLVTITFDEDVDTDILDDGELVLVDEDGDETAVDIDTVNDDSVTVDENEIEVEFPDFGDEDEIVRLVIEQDAIEGVDSGNNNAPQSFDLEGDPEDTPRLVSASVSLGDEDDDDDDNDEDTITYRFSEAVNGDDASDTLAEAENFFAVLADGSVILGDSGDDDDTDGSRVEIEFDEGQIDESVVRVGIFDAAVGEEDTPGNTSVGTQTVGLNGLTVDAGKTIGPDVESITIEEDTDTFGNVEGYEIVIDFDEVLEDADVTDNASEEYESDGDESDEDFFSDCSVDDDDESLVVCEVDEDDTEDVVAIALQQGFAADDDGHESFEVSVPFEVTSEA